MHISGWNENHAVTQKFWWMFNFSAATSWQDQSVESPPTAWSIKNLQCWLTTCHFIISVIAYRLKLLPTSMIWRFEFTQVPVTFSSSHLTAELWLLVFSFLDATFSLAKLVHKVLITGRDNRQFQLSPKSPHCGKDCQNILYRRSWSPEDESHWHWWSSDLSRHYFSVFFHQWFRVSCWTAATKLSSQLWNLKLMYIIKSKFVQRLLANLWHIPYSCGHSQQEHAQTC